MWTREQEQAISAREGTLLVSAAAGSGKTAVLVERVIGRLTDTENRCAADSLLIVTFTKAATSQMKERISAALSKKIAEEPDNKYLRRQLMLLPFAKICTIDSFCNDLVRENFHSINISPDFKILDKPKEILMREEASEQCVEALYEENSPEFRELVELFFKGRDDSELVNTIIRLSVNAGAYPFPDDWLESLKEPFISKCSLKESVWGQIISDYARNAVDYCIKVTESLIERAKADAIVCDAYTPSLVNDLKMYKSLCDTIEGSPWDKMREAFGNVKYITIGRVPSGYESAVKDSVQDTRKTLKSMLGKTAELMCASEEENEADLAYCAPVVCKLVEAVKSYRKILAEIKTRENVYDFSDISAFALKLLIEKDSDGKIQKTALAKELSERFTEILVDEYQDVNEAQDMLFEAVSRDGGNLFMVGDVKQSIYKFRQAMPEIFLRRRSSMPQYVKDNYPATITLDRNFRSRSGVTDTVNFIFNQIMSEQAGEVDYKNGEELVAAAEYPESNTPDAQLHIVDLSERKGFDKVRDEANYVAELINNMLMSGMTVKDGDTVRPAQYRDFCILLRSDKGRIPIFVESLERHNVSAYAETSGGFFDTAEIRFMLSLLRVIDNPVQDVSLVAVMLSPVFGFTPDDLARVRIAAGRQSNIYTCLRTAADKDEKISAFLANLDRLRHLSSTLPPSELVRRLLEETGFLAVAGAMTGGRSRRANLLLLEEIADRYDGVGHKGLPGFIRFIDKISEVDSSSISSQLSEAADVVRIMTIHKSKGLEFPVCILAGCAGEFNAQEYKQNYIIHQKYGIGIIRRDAQIFAQYPTVCKKAVTTAAKLSAGSEEMRVMYVALTRAKEKLVIVSSLENPPQKLRQLAANDYMGDSIPPFAAGQMTSYSDWILAAALRHPDCHVLREAAGVDSSIVLPADFRLDAFIAKPGAEQQRAATMHESTEVSEELARDVNERLSYVYPYQSLCAVVAKQTASGFDESEINLDYFASSRPAFLSSRELTPAQRGTVMHRFMQYADYNAAAADSKSELARLTAEGYFTEQESKAVNIRKIEAFFQSDAAKRMLSSEHIFREKRFTISKKAIELYPDLPSIASDEEIIIQGMVDCAFVEDGEIVIVDYKTDRASPEEIGEKYRHQLAVYREAMEKCTGKKVRQTLLYLFNYSTAIEV